MVTTDSRYAIIIASSATRPGAVVPTHIRPATNGTTCSTRAARALRSRCRRSTPATYASPMASFTTMRR